MPSMTGGSVEIWARDDRISAAHWRPAGTAPNALPRGGGPVDSGRNVAYQPQMVNWSIDG